jgi:methylated-DNA-[protein]-cysteine S-methyltransferase
MTTPETDTAALLARLYDPDPAALSRLRDTLVGDAAAAGLLDVAYRTLDSPVGTLLLAATEQGLVRVAFDIEDHDLVLVDLAEKVSPRIMLSPGRLDPVAHQLSEYFAGGRRSFDLPLDFRLASGFRRSVLAHLPDIAYGHTESYAQVALAAGSPRAVRAVGTACAMNPIPVVVPCHRVVRSDGSFGGYRGGAAAKELLLTMEAAA